MIIVAFFVFVKTGEKDYVKIPDSAIRLRVLANSNSPRDQKIKADISKKLQKELYSLLKHQRDINAARKIINSNMGNLSEMLDDEMKGYEYSYKLDYGTHYFPEKIYKGVKYPEGNYESLLVSLGKAEGDNWWCVLFPPLCVMEAEEKEASDVEYKFFFKEIIKKYF